jgi:hypothetical protein
VSLYVLRAGLELPEVFVFLIQKSIFSISDILPHRIGFVKVKPLPGFSLSFENLDKTAPLRCKSS